MIRLSLIGATGIVVGLLLPLPVSKMKQLDEVQAVLLSESAIWRSEKNKIIVADDGPPDAGLAIKSLIACQELHAPKVSKVERYEGTPSKWEAQPPVAMQPQMVEAALVQSLSYCGDSAQLIDLDCTERPCVALMAMPSMVECPWIEQGSPFNDLVELTAANLEWWPGKSDGFLKDSVSSEEVFSVYIRSYAEAELWARNSQDDPEYWQRRNPESDSDSAQNVLRRALLREEMFIDAIGDDILGPEDSE